MLFIEGCRHTNPSMYDLNLLINSLDALPLSYSRLVGAKAIKLRLLGEPRFSFPECMHASVTQ